MTKKTKKKIISGINQLCILEIAKFIEFQNPSLGPIENRNATRRFLKEKSLKCRSAKGFNSISVTSHSAATPTSTPPAPEPLNGDENSWCAALSDFCWNSILEEDLPLFQVPAKHDGDKNPKNCICETCVENPASFDLAHLFSDGPLEFTSELDNMMHELNAGQLGTGKSLTEVE